MSYDPFASQVARASHTCKECGCPMSWRRPDAQYCSTTCRMRHYRARLRAHTDEVKVAAGCRICGLNTPSYVLDYHHIDPATKLFGVGDTDRAKSMPRLRAEIAKCVVLCAIHHRMVEAGDIVLTKEA